MVVVVSRDKGPKGRTRIASSLIATRFLMNKLGISASEALEKLGLAKIDNMPRSFRRRLRDKADLPKNQEFSLGNQQITAPAEFRANSALSNIQIAELCRFVSSHPNFEIRYKTDRFTGYTKGSGCIECNSGFNLRVHKRHGEELLIPLDKVVSLILNKL